MMQRQPVLRCRRVVIWGRSTVLALLAALSLLAATKPSHTIASDLPSATRPLVVFETTLGDIVVEFDRLAAPLTTDYFLEYVERGQYDGATLYRSASLDDNNNPQIVQGGLLLDALNLSENIDPLSFGVSYLTVVETTTQTGLKHTRGIVSFARDLLDTGYVIPEIVFCLRAVPEMDAFGRDVPDAQGFPASGRVVSGLEVVEAVSGQPLHGSTTIPFLQGQILSQPVTIKRAFQTKR